MTPLDRAHQVEADVMLSIQAMTELIQTLFGFGVFVGVVLFIAKRKGLF